MTPEDRTRIFEQLTVVLTSDFLADFHTVLSEAYAVTKFTPEQANNEIRNTMLHCARVCAAETVEEAEENIKQARWHIDLAKRDCFKILILTIHESIKTILEITEYRYSTIKNADRNRLRDILRTFGMLLKKDWDPDPKNRHDPDLTDEFEAVYRDIIDFEAHILIAYPVTRTTRSTAYRIWLKVSRIANNIGFWIVSIFILAILSSPLMPQTIKTHYNTSVKYIFCKIASDTSCK
jgi:hypothetical protein